MANTVLSAALLLVLCLVTNVSAFWRMECRAELGYERIDPIISPGEPSSHVHVMFGAQSKSSPPQRILLRHDTKGTTRLWLLLYL